MRENRRSKATAAVLIVLVGACFLAAAAGPGKRVALVIGNANYIAAPLSSPVNDATDMASTLRGIGFAVTLKTDLDFKGMNIAVDSFAAGAKDAEVALFYFSGHGAQAAGENYLLPVDMGEATEASLRYGALAQGYVTDSLEYARSVASVIIIDACRSFPVARGTKAPVAGLVAKSAPEGAMVMYATAPGATAADGEGARNSVYTATLLKFLPRADLSLGDVATMVTGEVSRATAGAQKPAYLSSLTDRLFLGAKTAGAPPAPVASSPAAASPPAAASSPAEASSPAAVTPPTGASSAPVAATGGLIVKVGVAAGTTIVSSLMRTGGGAVGTITIPVSGEIDGLEPGTYLLSVSAKGYVDYKGIVKVKAGERATIYVSLVPR